MMRVDVFSAKGGVGKTTIAFRLARMWAEKSGLPVLLVDADLSGTCLGDLLEPAANWQNAQNLIHLVCGLPERLPEQLALDRLPVYELRPTPEETPQRVRSTTSGPTILFCPSNGETYLTSPAGLDPVVEPAVLHALLGHESAGGWVGHVIERVIDATKNRVSTGLGAVIVDHGPGLGALQWSQMCAVDAELANARNESRSPTRQALFVTTRDLVDLAAVRAIDDRIAPHRLRNLRNLHASALWALNRLPTSPIPNEWRTKIEETLKDVFGMLIADHKWFQRALPVFEDPQMADAYAESKLAAYLTSRTDADIAAIYDQLMTNSVPKAAQ